jgi:hypothetical protein
MDKRLELKFQGTPEQLDQFQTLLAHAGGEWVPDEPVQTTFPWGAIPWTDRWLTFGDSRIRFRQYPYRKEVLEVDTIYTVAKPHRPVSVDEFNRHVVVFAEFARSQADACGVTVLGPRVPLIELTKSTSFAAAQLAEEFVQSINHSPPRLPDQKSWRAFAIRAYRDEAIPDSDLVQDWLEQNGVNHERSRSLVVEYVNAIKVLSENEEMSGSR